MKRSMLVEIEKGKRYPFTATFDHEVVSVGRRGVSKTLMFRNLEDESGDILAKTIVFDDIKAFTSLDLEPGDTVSFEARFYKYQKMYDNSYEPVRPEQIKYPTKAVKLIKPVERILNPNKICNIKVVPTR